MKFLKWPYSKYEKIFNTYFEKTHGDIFVNHNFDKNLNCYLYKKDCFDPISSAYEISSVFKFLYGSIDTYGGNLIHKKPNGMVLQSHLAKGFIYYFISSNYIINNSIYVSEVPTLGLWLLKVLALGRIDWANAIFMLQKEIISQKKLIDPHRKKVGRINSNSYYLYPQRYWVFALELMAQRENTSINWLDSEVSPIDSLFLNAARKAYYTENIYEITEWVLALADAHIEYSSTTDGMGAEDELLGYELVDPLEHLWPFEIHALLKLRQEKGRCIPDIKNLNHPLFKYPTGLLYEYNLLAWKPEATLIGKVIDKIASEDTVFSEMKYLLYKEPQIIQKYNL